MPDQTYSAVGWKGLLWGIALLALLPGSAAAVSTWNTLSHNGVFITTDITAGFTPGVPPDVTVNPGSMLWDTLVAGGTDRAGTTESFNLATSPSPVTPASGVGTATGALAATLNFGDLVTNDTFSLGFSATASALSAFNTGGTAADALVSIHGSLTFSVDPFGVAPGTPAGQLDFGPLAAPGTYENIKFILTEYDLSTAGSSVTLITPDGSAPAPLALTTNHSYEFAWRYDIVVPHGTDPDFSYTLDASVVAAPVPLPAAIWMFAPALAGLFSLRRR
jgi:hypothetical protein